MFIMRRILWFLFTEIHQYLLEQIFLAKVNKITPPYLISFLPSFLRLPLYLTVGKIKYWGFFFFVPVIYYLLKKCLLNVYLIAYVNLVLWWSSNALSCGNNSSWKFVFMFHDPKIHIVVGFNENVIHRKMPKTC